MFTSFVFSFVFGCILSFIFSVCFLSWWSQYINDISLLYVDKKIVPLIGYYVLPLLIWNAVFITYEVVCLGFFLKCVFYFPNPLPGLYCLMTTTLQSAILIWWVGLILPFYLKNFREVLTHFTVANETEELTNSPSKLEFFIGIALSINTGERLTFLQL